MKQVAFHTLFINLLLCLLQKPNRGFFKVCSSVCDAVYPRKWFRTAAQLNARLT